MHGGKGSGAPKGNQNGCTHGGYATVVREDELELFQSISSTNLDEPIRIAALQWLRLDEAVQTYHDTDDEDDLRTVEIQEHENDKNHITRVKRRPSYETLLAARDRAALTLNRFMRTRDQREAMGLGSGDKSPEEVARAIQERLAEMDLVDDGGTPGEMDDSEAD